MPSSSAIPKTLESNVSGIYVAGVIVAGSRTNEIFIENGRFHGKQIAADLRETSFEMVSSLAGRRKPFFEPELSHL